MVTRVCGHPEESESGSLMARKQQWAEDACGVRTTTPWSFYLGMLAELYDQ